jgi:hypothetical protein
METKTENMKVNFQKIKIRVILIGKEKIIFILMVNV